MQQTHKADDFFRTTKKGGIRVNLHVYEYIGESFQGYSWIQDFEADFPQKVKSTESQPQNPELDRL